MGGFRVSRRGPTMAWSAPGRSRDHRPSRAGGSGPQGRDRHWEGATRNATSQSGHQFFPSGVTGLDQGGWARPVGAAKSLPPPRWGPPRSGAAAWARYPLADSGLPGHCLNGARTPREGPSCIILEITNTSTTMLTIVEVLSSKQSEITLLDAAIVVISKMAIFLRKSNADAVLLNVG